MVRYGNFLNMGDVVFRYTPSSLQADTLLESADGAMSLDVHSFTTYTGIESVTLMSHLQALWASDSHLEQVDVLSVRNEIAWSLTSRVALGAGVDVVWADQAVTQDRTDRRAVQYDVLLRWRW